VGEKAGNINHFRQWKLGQHRYILTISSISFKMHTQIVFAMNLKNSDAIFSTLQKKIYS